MITAKKLRFMIEQERKGWSNRSRRVPAFLSSAYVSGGPYPGLLVRSHPIYRTHWYITITRDNILFIHKRARDAVVKAHHKEGQPNYLITVWNTPFEVHRELYRAYHLQKTDEQ